MMFDLRSRLKSYGTAAALGVAILTTSAQHWTVARLAYNNVQQNVSTSPLTPTNGLERFGSSAITKISFNIKEYHHFY